MVEIKKITYTDNLRQGTDKINSNFDTVVDEIKAVDDRVDTIIVGGGPDKDPELVDIRNLDPSYTPQREINVAGDVTRDMQAQFVAHKAETVTGVFNVKTGYGAVGDGVTDDTSAIQRAINTCSESGGGTVFFPNATYKINSPLVVSSGVYLEFAPKAIIDASDVAVGKAIITFEGSEGTEYALSANGNKGDTSVSVTAGVESNFSAGDWVRIASDDIYDPGRTNTVIGEINRVLSTSSGSIALMWPLQGGTYKTVNNATISKINMSEDVGLIGGTIICGGTDSAHLGVLFSRCFSPVIERCTIRSAEGTGIAFRDCVGGKATLNNIYRSDRLTSGYGIAVQNASQDILISHNYIERCRHFFTTSTATGTRGIPRRVVVTHNHCVNSVSGDGLDTHAACEYITFAFNRVYGVQGNGINIECPIAFVEFNEVHMASNHGVSFHNESAQEPSYTCIGNKIYNPGQFGVRLSVGVASGTYAGIRQANISENEIIGGTVSIGVIGRNTWRMKNVKINNNHIDSPTGFSGNIYVEKSDKVTIRGNTIENVPTNATVIRINDVKKSVIAKNEVTLPSGATAYAFYLLSLVDSSIMGNVVDSPSPVNSRGIYQDNNCSYNTILGNNLRGCTVPLTIGTGTGHIYQTAAGDEYNIV